MSISLRSRRGQIGTSPQAVALRAGLALGALCGGGAAVGGHAALLVGTCGVELVVGLQRLGDVAGCEVHDQSVSGLGCGVAVWIQVLR